MTLHDTTELSKKVGIGSAIGIVLIIVLVLFFQGGVIVKNILFPRPIEPPNFVYDKLPAIEFPENATTKQLTYTKNTLSGELPDFPDRLIVFPIIQNAPNLLNLDLAKNKADALGFVTADGRPISEIALGGAEYEWKEETGIERSLIFDIVNFDFTLTSNYTTSLVALLAQEISDQKSAIKTSTDFLGDISLFPEDIDLTKTEKPDPVATFNTEPELFSIQNGNLVPATSLSKVQVFRVDLYQKNIEYELKTGKTDDKNVVEAIVQNLPILYPHPPHSTMNFYVASGDIAAEVVEANFVHQSINLTPETEGTYAIKSAEEAFTELKEGKAYIAAHNTDDTQILINNVFLAYYLGDTRQEYLMPIIVFEGDKGFFAYVSAIKDEWIQ